MTEDNLQAKYFELLREAHETSEAEDVHNLHSDVPESVAAHAALKKTSEGAQTALIEFIRLNHSYLLGEFGGARG